MEIGVIGEKGRIRSTGNGLTFEHLRMVEGSPRNRGLPAQVPFPWPARMQGMGLTITEDLIQAGETGRPPKCSGRDGRAALEIAMALRESHRRGGVKISLPLADRSLAIHSAEIAHDDLPARVRREQQGA